MRNGYRVGPKYSQWNTILFPGLEPFSNACLFFHSSQGRAGETAWIAIFGCLVLVCVYIILFRPCPLNQRQMNGPRVSPNPGSHARSRNTLPWSYFLFTSAACHSNLFASHPTPCSSCRISMHTMHDRGNKYPCMTYRVTSINQPKR